MNLHDWQRVDDTLYKCAVCGQTTRCCQALCPGQPFKTPLIQAVEKAAEDVETH